MSTPTAHRYENWIRSQLQFDICVSEALNDIVHNAHNDQSYNGLPRDGVLLFNEMSQFKNQHEQKLGNVIHADQWDVLCPSSGSTDSKQFDVTLNVPVIRYNVKIPPPTDPQGWQAKIVSNPDNKADYVLVARQLRNKSKHGATSDMNTRSKYDSRLADIEALLVGLGYRNMKLFEDLKTGSIEPYFNQILKRLDQKLSDLEKKVDANDNSIANLRRSLIDMQNERCFNQAALYQCLRKMADVEKLLEYSSKTYDTVSKTHDVACKTYGVTREGLEINQMILDGVNQLIRIHQSANSGSVCEKQGYQIQRRSNYSYSDRGMLTLIQSIHTNDHQTFLDEMSKDRERLYERVYETTYLHLCAINDRPSISDRLLRMDGSIIDVRNVYHQTALMVASMNRSTSCVRVLLRYGANINAVDDVGLTTLWYAIYGQEKEVERIVREAMRNEPSLQGEPSIHTEHSTHAESSSHAERSTDVLPSTQTESPNKKEKEF